MSVYFLARDCFVRRMDPHWIVLNVGRDRYYCLQHRDLTSIGLDAEGSIDLRRAEAAGSPDQVDTILRSLMAAGIITSDPGSGKPFVESRVAHPLDALMPQERPPALQATSLPRFFSACAWADWSLRRRSIAATLARLRRRRGPPPEQAPEDRRRLAELVAVFNRLRPLYPHAYRCLFDSLALLGFLTRHGLPPRIVFGVTGDPFQAHCWVQLGTLLINEDDERVRRFAPIMSA